MMGKTQNIAYIALFTALFAICAWLTVPFVVPFTMQTFAVLLATAILGARRTVCALMLYLALGMLGIPVFSGFTGGFGILAGPTGGYLLGFFPMVLVAAGLMRIFGRGFVGRCTAMAGGIVICYAFGTAWYCMIYLHGTDSVTLTAVLAECVLPFVLPDAAKILLAAWTEKHLRPIMRKST